MTPLPSPLPGIAFLESKDEYDPAEQTGEADELLAFDGDPAVHEQQLSDDKEERERDDHDATESPFGRTFEEAENGYQGKKETDKRCHRLDVFMDKNDHL
jgi:hypothetical protein